MLFAVAEAALEAFNLWLLAVITIWRPAWLASVAAQRGLAVSPREVSSTAPGFARESWFWRGDGEAERTYCSPAGSWATELPALEAGSMSSRGRPWV
jgi:hypothetical protein